MQLIIFFYDAIINFVSKEIICTKTILYCILNSGLSVGSNVLYCREVLS